MLTKIATDLPRFMVCNGSHVMPQHTPFNVDDSVRNDGNAVHWLIEQVHKGLAQPHELVGRKASNGVFITDEMVEHSTPFLNDILDKGIVECDTSYGDGRRYQINGRADWNDYNPSTGRIYVSDFKYGWSIVEPKDNWTLISHALGYSFKNKVPVKEVVLRIYQPRPHHPLGKVREHVYSFAELSDLWKQLEATLINPLNELHTSPYCRDCPALATCNAAQKAGMNSIDVSEATYAADIDNKSLGFLLDQIDRALKVLEQNKKAYSELALHRLKTGDIIPGYGMEKELTNKQWKPGINVESAMMITGIDLGKKQLITPAQAIKEGVSEAAIEALCERREKGIKLARMDADTAVKKMFGDVK